MRMTGPVYGGSGSMAGPVPWSPAPRLQELPRSWWPNTLSTGWSHLLAPCSGSTSNAGRVGRHLTSRAERGAPPGRRTASGGEGSKPCASTLSETREKGVRSADHDLATGNPPRASCAYHARSVSARCVTAALVRSASHRRALRQSLSRDEHSGRVVPHSSGRDSHYSPNPGPLQSTTWSSCRGQTAEGPSSTPTAAGRRSLSWTARRFSWTRWRVCLADHH